MSTFSYMCPCGDIMSIDAPNKEEAVQKLKEKMTLGAIEKHMRERHPGEAIPPLEETHAMIEMNTAAV